MRSIESLRSILPKDAEPIFDKEGAVKGIKTHDGSFDYTFAGAECLRSLQCSVGEEAKDESKQ